MLAKLPVVFGINAKTRLGRVRQIAEPSITIDYKAVKYTLGNSGGHVLRDDAGANLLYLFS